MLIRKVVNIACSVTIILIMIVVIFDKFYWTYIIIVIAVWVFITAYGVANIRAGYFLKSLNYNPNTKRQQIAITFDDGPNQNTLKILEVLDKFSVKATFFCIGKQVQQYPEITREITAKGHIIANHTYSHDKLIDLYSTKRFTEEIIATDTIIKEITGKTPLLFRPPYGITNPEIARAVKKTGHQVIGWNKRSFDTTIPLEKVILKRVTKNLQPGDVILLHDTKFITIAVLEQLLLFLQKNNYTTITIDELFSIQAYA